MVTSKEREEERMTDFALPTFDLSEPGSILYDGRLAAAGLRINRFGTGMKTPANRERFRADPDAYLAQADLTVEERARIGARDWTWLLANGGHLQALMRIAAIDGQYIFHIAAHSIGVDAQDLADACPRRVSGLDGLDG